MNQKKVIVILFILLCLFTYSQTKIEKPKAEKSILVSKTQEFKKTPELGVIGETDSISRKEMARIIALLFFSDEQITHFQKNVDFTDISEDAWYKKYIYAAWASDMLIYEGRQFFPEKPVTVEECELFLNRLKPNNGIKLQYDETSKNKSISYALFSELLCKIVANQKNFQTEIITIHIEETKNFKPDIVTNKGVFYFDEFPLHDYLWMEIKVLAKNHHILSLLELTNDQMEIKNAYIKEMQDKNISFLQQGELKTFELNMERPKFTSNIGNITIQNQKVTQIEFIEQIVNTEIVQILAHELGLKNKNYPIDTSLKIYQTMDTLAEKKLQDIVIGNEYKCYIKNGQIQAILIYKEARPFFLRININNSAFNSLYHDQVKLSCDQGMMLKYQNDVQEIAPNEIFSISPSEHVQLLENNRLVFIPKNNGQIKIHSITRAWPGSTSPSYRGVMEVFKQEGKFLIVNELSLEKYLYSVIPSEMPSYYGIEAAKVQAVTARSYAYNQYYVARMKEFGGHMDDSTNCQVYNNIPANDNSIQAVNQTAGECLTYHGEVISTYFYSTSCGMGANSGDVWGTSEAYPIATPPYLAAVKSYFNFDFNDLSQEIQAEKFLKMKDLNAYDNDFPWFRWKVTMTKKNLEENIQKQLPQIISRTPHFVKVMQADGTMQQEKIKNIGSLADMQVIKRGQGGNIMILRLIGTEKTVDIYTEYNIRKILSPNAKNPAENIIIHRKDGTTINNLQLMPSAFFVFQKNYQSENNLSSVDFYGGGYGHGVGMSQNGAKKMIDNGSNYQQVLQHYYPQTEVKKILLYE